MEHWADREMWTRLIPDHRKWRPVTKGVLTLVGISLIIVALANPQMGKKQERGKRTGCDIAICIDVSNSMMAKDVKPNRLAHSKQVVNNLLSTMTGDRVSLVVFAGTSFIMMPLTNDYNAAKMFLEQVDCSMIPYQGTAIGSAIENAMATFGYGDAEREWNITGSRAILVISDGENHEDDAIGVAKGAAREGVRVCTIGVGSTSGATIPDGGNGGLLRDNDGNIVVTQLNEKMLKEIAEAGKGVYVNGSNGIDDILNLLEKLEKNEFDESVFNSFESRYQYPLVAGLLCLLAEVFIFERRNKKWRMIFVLAFLLIGGSAHAQEPSRTAFASGNNHYRQKQYEEAAADYSKVLSDTTLSPKQRSRALYNLGNCHLKQAQEKGDDKMLVSAAKYYNEAIKLDPNDFRTHYNLGNTLYLQKRYSDAAAQFNQALLCDNLTDAQKANSLFNQGNSLYQEAQSSRDTATLKTAIGCYRDALRLDPTNADYRYNQTLAYRLLEELKKQDKQQQQQNKQQQQQKQDQQKQQQNQQQNQQQQQQQGQQQPQQQNQQNKQQRQPNKNLQQQNAENLLEAVKKNERKTMQNLNNVQPIGSGRAKKDW